jgi:hypothetical protein
MKIVEFVVGCSKQHLLAFDSMVHATYMEFLSETYWKLSSINLGIVTNALTICMMQISWRNFLIKLHIVLKGI